MDQGGEQAFGFDEAHYEDVLDAFTSHDRVRAVGEKIPGERRPMLRILELALRPAEDSPS
jgi:hypothetical protein